MKTRTMIATAGVIALLVGGPVLGVFLTGNEVGPVAAQALQTVTYLCSSSVAFDVRVEGDGYVTGDCQIGGGVASSPINTALGQSSVSTFSVTAQDATVSNLLATPYSGWGFARWVIDGNPNVGNNPINLEIKAQYSCSSEGTSWGASQFGARSIVAVFTPVPSFTLLVSVSGMGQVTWTAAVGSIDTDAGRSRVTLPLGTSVALQASPFPGWQFSHWEIQGNPSVTNPLTFSMNANVTVTAFF